MNIGGGVKIESYVFSWLRINGQSRFHRFDWLCYFFAGHILFQQVLWSSQWLSSGRCFVSMKENIARFLLWRDEPQRSQGPFPRIFFAAGADDDGVRISCNFLFSEFLLCDYLVASVWSLRKIVAVYHDDKSNDHLVYLQPSFLCPSSIDHLEFIWFQVRIEA